MGEIRALVVSAREAAFTKAGANASSPQTNSLSEGHKSSLHAKAERVSIYTLEQDPALWLEEKHKHACNDPSKRMFFASFGRKEGWDHALPWMIRELARMF